MNCLESLLYGDDMSYTTEVQTTTMKKVELHLQNTIVLIKQFVNDPEFAKELTEESLIKTLEEAGARVCWSNTEGIAGKNITFLTPNAYQAWKKYGGTLNQAKTRKKVLNSDKLTIEDAGGARSGTQRVVRYYLNQYRQDNDYDKLRKNIMEGINKLSKCQIWSTREENIKLASILKRGPLDFKHHLDISQFYRLEKFKRVKFENAQFTMIDSDLTPYFPKFFLT